MKKSSTSSVVRQYRKSSAPRLRWTPELHDRFVEAVKNLGGKYKATPKRIMQMMGVRGLKLSHIKSHLQMYRSMKESTESNGFMNIKNYLKKELEYVTLFSTLRQDSEAPSRRTQGRRKPTQIDENIPHQHLQVQERPGTSESMDVRKSRFGWTNIMEVTTAAQAISLINTKSTESCTHHPLNLDLTMSFH